MLMISQNKCYNVLKGIRSKLELSQEKMAQRLDVSLAEYKKLENMAVLSENIRIGTIKKLASSLQVNSDWLFSLGRGDNNFIISDEENALEQQYQNISFLRDCVNATKDTEDISSTTILEETYSINQADNGKKILISESLKALRSIDIDLLPIVYEMEVHTRSNGNAYTSGYERIDKFVCCSEPFDVIDVQKRKAVLGLIYLLSTFQNTVEVATPDYELHFAYTYDTRNENTRDILCKTLEGAKEKLHLPEKVLSRFKSALCGCSIRNYDIDFVTNLNCLTLIPASYYDIGGSRIYSAGVGAKITIKTYIAL